MLTIGISTAKSQDSYTASNGRTYKLGDTVRTGKGSGVNGEFVYLAYTGLNDTPLNDTRIKRKFTNGAVIINKIRQKEQYGVIKTTFVVSKNLKLEIEPAIEAKEVLN